MAELRSILLLLVCLPAMLMAQSKEVAYTLEDRDRLIQIEERLSSQQIQVDDLKKGQESLRQEIKDVRIEIKDVKQELTGMFYWGFGIMITFMMFLLGFIIWDRRTAINPVKERTWSLSAENRNIRQALIDYAKDRPKLADILRSHGLM